MSRAVIFGCAGPALGAEEAAFFRRTSPWGFILFGRNIVDPPQVRALVRALRAAVGRSDAPVLIDQEGGRVARLGSPHWRRFPPAAAFADLARTDPRLGRDMAWLCGRLIAHDLNDLGITFDCAPVMDVSAPSGHEVIGDRAYASDPAKVAILGRAMAEGLLAGAVAPVIKHIPGHGRATVDSHHDLPVVPTSLSRLRAVDFLPFKALADAPAAMTAHVVYSAVDPLQPATLSRVAISEVIRSHIGFSGVLISDDLGMNALRGSFAERTRASLAAGCDIALHCHGDLAEKEKVAEAAQHLAGQSAIRADAALRRVAAAPESFDVGSARRRFDAAFDMGFAA